MRSELPPVCNRAFTSQNHIINGTNNLRLALYGTGNNERIKKPSS